jgi:hypothetical protein
MSRMLQVTALQAGAGLQPAPQRFQAGAGLQPAPQRLISCKHNYRD